MTWWGWGIPDERPDLPPPARRWLAAQTGWRPRPTPPVETIEVPASEFPAGLMSGACRVSTSADDRLRHAGGKSYVDLMRRRSGRAVFPDAVLFPSSPDAVLAALQRCADEGVAVVPFGGGTSVVGGVEPARNGFRYAVALDLAELDRLIDVDSDSRTAVLQAGLRTPRAESLLGEHGFTLGHFPQSAEFATIGGYAATRSAGQASSGFGRFDDMVVGLRVATPAGPIELGRAPRSAAGPDLRHLFLGSEGAFGIITEVTLRVRPVAEASQYEGYSFPSFSAGLAAIRALAQDGFPPDVVRLSDVDETQANLASAGAGPRLYLRGRGHGAGCIAILGWEGSELQVPLRHQLARRIIAQHGAIRLGTKPGVAWRRERFAAPYLRDLLLGTGLLVETLETATSWSGLPALHDAVRSALFEALNRPVVMCHVSHVYPAGASLYFTVLADRDDSDPLGQWERAKTAASKAIVAAGGTITHHHGVGLEHRNYLTNEIGQVGVTTLRAIKKALDPAGILNPGKLIP
jgi:alkyldihydroxyacetonephosphate synthase